jgi:MSHA biogenesis protein MshM
MPQETLEALRLLTNLETEKRKLLQVVLFGQPELDQRLAHSAIRQLRQRITFQYRLSMLKEKEVEHYLSHRLRVAGYRGSQLFVPAAVRRLHRASGGVPRLINIMAHKSLLLAFGEGMQQVLPRHVRSAAADTPATGGRRYRLLVMAALLALAGVVAVVLSMDWLP